MSLTLVEHLTHSTVRIECELSDGGVATGTGFFLVFASDGRRGVPAIVTNKHVVEGAKRGHFVLTVRSPSGDPAIGHTIPIEVPDFEKYCIDHPDEDVDLCVYPLAPLLQLAEERSQRVFYSPIDLSMVPDEAAWSELTALQEVVMVGYPNGLWDRVNNMPLVRRGVAATHPSLDYDGNSEFVVDMACFPGSSGSPVFLVRQGSWTNRQGHMVVTDGTGYAQLLGILYAGFMHTAEGEIKAVPVPTGNQKITLSDIPNNLGLVIKSNRLLEFEPILKAMG
ncbi:MAG: serine protease [Planctomycetota bacterium]|nr:serine protease [Planctomycetota bacterium]